jgi:hypothetical protein
MATIDLQVDVGISSTNLPLFVCFAAFVVTFVTTRVITRMIRAGRGPFHDNVSTSGVHVHHAVPGIILLVIGAFTAVATNTSSAWTIVAALLVGIGTSLVLDEFALILHLQDVYWTDEGRISVEMVSLAVACLGLLLIGFRPFDLRDDGPGASALVVAISIALLVLSLLVCIAKGKYKLALFGAFIPVVALVGALRLARPGSRWAKRRYGSEKLVRATARAGRYDARFGPATDWVCDFVAGKPSEPDPASR